MHKNHNKFLVISFVGVLILGVYSYFHNDLINKAFSADSSLTSSLGATTPVSTNNVSAQASEDTAFLMNLASLTNITIDTSLFTDKSFNLLNDNSIKLEPVPYGRTNPFSPTDSALAPASVSTVLHTNPATLITNKSAIFNGLLEGAVSDNVYFEYGNTETMGKVTPKVTTSLVGSFASIVTGLTSKTTYFYRSVANINGVKTPGEIISFNTN